MALLIFYISISNGNKSYAQTEIIAFTRFPSIVNSSKFDDTGLCVWIWGEGGDASDSSPSIITTDKRWKFRSIYKVSPKIDFILCFVVQSRCTSKTRLILPTRSIKIENIKCNLWDDMIIS